MFQSIAYYHKSLLVLLITGCIWLGTPAFVQADGIIIPDPPPVSDPPIVEESWLTIRYHRVDVTIEDQVATTRIEQEFINEHAWEVEGTYIFPLPDGAVISDFQIWVDGKEIAGQILPADEARKIYEDIVRKRKDPALLEYIGRDVVQARIYPILPGESRKMELVYSQVLQFQNGMVQYSYPLNTEKFSARALEECAVRVDVKSHQPIRSLYSPTHQDRVVIDRKDDHHAVIGYEETRVIPDQDFELIYSISQDEVGLHLIPYRETGAHQGYFLLMAAPTVEVDRVLPRDLVLVLDTSGSMEGEKLSQAKKALVYVLNHLNPEDRFNIIAFSTGVRSFASGLQPVSQTAAAVDWVQKLEALGGTDINLALLEALNSRSAGEDNRPFVLLFLTDGLPTEGVTEIEQILNNVRSSSSSSVRLFPFGVGDDVNTLLLDTLAEQNRGRVSYVGSHEHIDEEVSAYYAGIRSPVLTDLKLDFSGVVVEELYPAALPDLFAGSQLVLAGRFRNLESSDGKAWVRLRGMADGKEKMYIAPVNFSNAEHTVVQEHIIPRLWAMRKIGHMLTQIRLHGEKNEWVEAVIGLSIRYGIITPYTSYLIEEEDIFTQHGRDEISEEWLSQENAAPVVGGEAVRQAEAEGILREADSAFGTGNIKTYDPDGMEQVSIRFVGEKTFLLRNTVWTDTLYVPDEVEPLRIQFGSDHYFQLLDQYPAWGPYFALGDHVIFVDGDQAYEIGPEEDAQEISRFVEDFSLKTSSTTKPDSFQTPIAPCSSWLWVGFLVAARSSLGKETRNGLL